jgi:tRNA dimethylallyltransferase
MKKRILAICGPTASGKTVLAIQAAQYFNTSILSFDSRQCYKELHIGVAKPTTEEVALVPHYFINSHSIHDTVNAVVYEQYALAILEKLFLTTDTVIVVGGTGLYLDALCTGVDAIPAIPEALRTQLQNAYAANGMEWLQTQIQALDSSYTTANDLNNVQRMLRALEVVTHTGNSIRFYQKKEPVNRPFEIIKCCVTLDRETLYNRINKRVDAMLDAGLLQEVEQLLPFQGINALQTVGYSELFVYFNNHCSLDFAIDKIKQHTRNYAKRQITWFKKDTSIVPVTTMQDLKAFLFKLENE